MRENVPGNPAAAVYVQDQLRRIGVGVDIRLVDQSSIYSQMRQRRFEAALVPYQHGGTVLVGDQSWIGYTSAAAAALMERFQTTPDPDARDGLYRSLTTTFRAESPVTFLCPWVSAVVVHRRLRGLRGPWRVNPLQQMEELWLDDRPLA